MSGKHSYNFWMVKWSNIFWCMKNKFCCSKTVLNSWFLFKKDKSSKKFDVMNQLTIFNTT